MKKKRILVSVSNDLYTDQRVEKMCHTLHQEGFDIFLLGRKRSNSKPLNRPYTTKRISFLFNKGPVYYAELNLRFFIYLLFAKKDILYANDTDILWANYWVSKLQNKPLIFDSHELFSEVPEIQNKPLVKRVWLRVERAIIPKLKNVITVSNNIAQHYEKLYNIKATVIRNVPIKNSSNAVPFDFNSEGKKIILYQGSINVGRGLELMIDTMKLLPNHLFVIIGDGDILEELKQKASFKNLKQQIFFLGKVSPQKLKTLTPNADIGISLEEDLGLNYRYALPNKLFDYIQAEVSVIVSDLPDMKSLVENQQVGNVLKERTPKALAKLITETLNQNFSKHLSIAKEELTWNKESKKLIELIQNID